MTELVAVLATEAAAAERERDELALRLAAADERLDGLVKALAEAHELARPRPAASTGHGHPAVIRDRLMLAFSTAAEPLTSRQLQELTGGSQARVDGHLGALVEEGIVERAEGERGRLYSLAESPPDGPGNPTRPPDSDPSDSDPIVWTPAQERALLSIRQVLRDGPKTPGELAAAIVRSRAMVVQILNAEIDAGRIREVTGRDAAIYPDAVELV